MPRPLSGWDQPCCGRISQLATDRVAAQSHQARHPVLTPGDALPLELPVDTGTTVRPVALIVHGLDLLVQLSIRHLSLAGRPHAPGIVLAARYVQHLAHATDRERFLVIVDGLEPHLPGRERMTTDFLGCPVPAAGSRSLAPTAASVPSRGRQVPTVRKGIFTVLSILLLPAGQTTRRGPQLIRNLLLAPAAPLKQPDRLDLELARIHLSLSQSSSSVAL